MDISISTETLVVHSKCGSHEELFLVKQSYWWSSFPHNNRLKGNSTEKLFDIQQSQDKAIVQSMTIFNATRIMVILGELSSTLFCGVS